MKKTAALLSIIVLTVAGWLYLGGSRSPGPGALPAPTGSAQRSDRGQAPAFTLADSHGQQRHSSEWSGNLLVINFWATWCGPCLKEIPEFIALQERYGDRGVQFVGIALDAPNKVLDFAKRLKINYPVLIGGADAIAVARQYGNSMGALPYTAVIDPKGRVVALHTGIYPGEQLEGLILETLHRKAPSPS